MKRWINLGLILSFFLCYLEWGGGKSSFIGQAAYEILFKQPWALSTFVHPVILSALLGLISVGYAVIVNKPIRWINVFGVIVLSLPVLLFFLVGALELNSRMLLSNLPFLVLAVVFFVLTFRKKPIVA